MLPQLLAATVTTLGSAQDVPIALCTPSPQLLPADSVHTTFRPTGSLNSLRIAAVAS